MTCQHRLRDLILKKKTTSKTTENGTHLMTMEGDVDLCRGPSILSEISGAGEYPRKAEVPRKEVWDCPKYLYNFKRKDF